MRGLRKTLRKKRKQNAGMIAVDPNVIIDRIRTEYLPGTKKTKLLHFAGHPDRWLAIRPALWISEDPDNYVNTNCGKDEGKSKDCASRDFIWIESIREALVANPRLTNEQLISRFPLPGSDPPPTAQPPPQAAPPPRAQPPPPRTQAAPPPRAQPPPQPAPPPPPPRHSAREQATREQAAREQAEREASRESYAKWKAAREEYAREQAAREKAAREKYVEEAAHFSRMRYASQQAAQKRYAKEAAESAIREAERKKVAAEKAAQIRDEQRKAKKKADSRKAKDKAEKEKRDAYTKAVRSKNSDATFYDMDIDAVSKEDIRKNKLKAFQYYIEKYPALRSKAFIDPDYYSPIIEQILNGDSSNYEKLFKELSNYNSPAVEAHRKRFGFIFGSSRGRLPSLPTRRVRRFSSSKKRRYTHRRRA
jgi:hypothetical protein